MRQQPIRERLVADINLMQVSAKGGEGAYLGGDLQPCAGSPSDFRSWHQCTYIILFYALIYPLILSP